MDLWPFKTNVHGLPQQMYSSVKNFLSERTF